MTNTNIPQSQQGLFKQFLLQRRNEVAESIKNLLKEQEDIEATLKGIEILDYPIPISNNDEIVIYDNGYIPKWTYVKKIKFVLNLKKKALTARQITDVIINELERELWINKDKKEKAGLFGTISSTLTNNSKDGKDFVKAQNEIDENIYSIREK